MNKTNAYYAGYDAKKEEISGMGWQAARDKFNLDNPIGIQHQSKASEHYAAGGFQALLDSLP